MSSEITPISIAILGLENAGKTTLLRRMCGKEFQETLTTIGLNVEQIEYKGYLIQAIDLGGQRVFRDTLWSHYATLANGIIFVFDIFDEARVREAKIWFNQLLSWVSRDATIVFLANKIDLKKKNKKYLTLEKIIKFFDLSTLSSTPNMSFRIFEVSAKTGENVDEAMNWLLEKITSRIKEQMRIDLVLFYDMYGRLIYEHFTPKEYIERISRELLTEIKRLREIGVRQSYLQIEKLRVMIGIENEFSVILGTEYNLSAHDLKIAMRSIIEAIKVKYSPINEHIDNLEGIVNTILLKIFTRATKAL